jgi:hypothetical protein
MTDQPIQARADEESQKAQRLGLADANLLAQAKSKRELAAIFAQLAQAMSAPRHRQELTEHAERLELEALRLEFEAKAVPGGRP